VPTTSMSAIHRQSRVQLEESRGSGTHAAVFTVATVDDGHGLTNLRSLLRCLNVRSSSAVGRTRAQYMHVWQGLTTIIKHYTEH
jgi:hypothetical protein